MRVAAESRPGAACVAGFLHPGVSGGQASGHRRVARRRNRRPQFQPEIFHLRSIIVDAAIKALADKLPASAARKALHARFKEMLDQHFICYAYQLHLFRGKDITNPDKVTNPGFAEQFERVTKFPTRMAKAAVLPNPVREGSQIKAVA
jgi:hypothetical protein